MLSKQDNQLRIHHTLRIACGMCFIGHGAFGIMTKPIWCNYFAVFRISHGIAYSLMPILGCFDILMGIGILLFPVRAIPGWLVLWAFFTALLRPLSGENLAEFFERGGNYGAPMALLLLLGRTNTIRDWVSRIEPNHPVSSQTMAKVILCLRSTATLIFLGHGWLNVIAKKGLIDQYTSLGFSNPASVALTIGIIEIASAIVIFIRPTNTFLIVLIIWKMASELFYPHDEFFEWVERGGSYGTMIALWLSLLVVSRNKTGSGNLPEVPFTEMQSGFLGNKF